MSETNLTPKQIDAINTSPNDWIVCFILVIFLGLSTSAYHGYLLLQRMKMLKK